MKQSEPSDSYINILKCFRCVVSILGADVDDSSSPCPADFRESKRSSPCSSANDEYKGHAGERGGCNLLNDMSCHGPNLTRHLPETPSAY